VTPSNRPLEDLVRERPDIETIDLAAMVPSQVYCSIGHPLLPRIRHLIVGGGAIPQALEERLRPLPTAVWSSYGMTETLSHIALRRVSGSEASPWFTPMPGVTLSVDENQCLVIDAPHLCPERLVTRDVVEIEQGSQRFKVLGRIDNVINTGGIKLHIEQVERQLAGHIARPFLITKRPDAQFGEMVVMLLQGSDEDIPAARAASEEFLDKYARPKRIIVVPELPMTPNAKPDRRQAETLAQQLFS
jgi:O-succinylbenzoic acid--CoA ligase